MEKYKEQWMLITRYIITINNVGTNKNDIASYIFSYLKERGKLGERIDK